MHNNFFYFGLCHFCKSTSDYLQTCSSCKTVSYCSKHHQKADWKSHKDICKAISLTFKSKEVKPSCTFQEWKDYRANFHFTWSTLLKRELLPFESQIWMFPRICNVCYKRLNLQNCINCKNVAYCSTQHLEQDKINHNQYCKLLRLCMDVDTFLYKEKCYPQIRFTDKTIKLPNNIKELLQIEENTIMTESNADIRHVLKSEIMSPGATIAYTIKMSCFSQSHHDIIIHVVGAAAPEATMDWTIISEIIFHTTPNITNITYILIGPEVFDTFSNLNLCNTCRDKQRTFDIKIFKRLYHDIVDDIPKANLIILFNCGLHEFENQECDDWKNSIKHLLKHRNIPLALTSYTKEEMIKDLQTLRSNPFGEDCSLLISRKNPFTSLRPIRDWCTENIPIFYANRYIAILKKQ